MNLELCCEIELIILVCHQLPSRVYNNYYTLVAMHNVTPWSTCNAYDIYKIMTKFSSSKLTCTLLSEKSCSFSKVRSDIQTRRCRYVHISVLIAHLVSRTFVNRCLFFANAYIHE